jgi:hypothetical protein
MRCGLFRMTKSDASTTGDDVGAVDEPLLSISTSTEIWVECKQGFASLPPSSRGSSDDSLLFDEDDDPLLEDDVPQVRKPTESQGGHSASSTLDGVRLSTST